MTDIEKEQEETIQKLKARLSHWASEIEDAIDSGTPNCHEVEDALREMRETADQL